MKILITTDCYKPVINGVVTSVDCLSDGLLALGHDVKILALSGNHHSYKTDNVTYIGSISLGIIYPNTRMKLIHRNRYIREIIKWKPDVIHSQCEFSTFFVAKKVSELCGAPIIHTYHTVYEDYTHYFSPNVKLGKMMAASFTRFILSKTKTVIAPTEKIKDLLLSYDVKQPINIIPSGLKLDRFTTKIPDKELFTIRNKLGIADNDRVIIYVGRLAKEKNIEELINLISDDTFCTLKLLLVGDGPYREELKNYAKSLGIGTRVIFTGMIEPEKVAVYYRLGDIFISASQSETQGLTYIEAMASGLPIICKKDKCLDSVVENGYNGFVYDTPEMFKQYLQKLCTDDATRKIIGENAAKTVNERYSSMRFSTDVFNLYQCAVCV